jgi:hypothetical protein
MLSLRGSHCIAAATVLTSITLTACSSKQADVRPRAEQPSVFSLEGFAPELELIRERARRQGPPSLAAFAAPTMRAPLLEGVTKPDLLATFSEVSSLLARVSPESAEQIVKSELPSFDPVRLRESRGQANSAYTIADYAREVAAELGTIPSFSVFEQGTVIPITLDDIETPSGQHSARSACDRPALLGLGREGQCVPYSRIGRLQGTDPVTGLVNPDVQWVFIARRYKIRTDPNNPIFEDVAIIGHNKRTGATAFFQMLDENGKNAARVPSPMEPASQTPSGAPTAAEFWLLPSQTADIGCNRCHDSDPFVHTPYIDQVRTVSSTGVSRPVVPSNPTGKYRFIGSQAFTDWRAPEHFDLEDNSCVSCHRIGTQASSESFAKWATGEASTMQLSPRYRSYPNSHWMPPEEAEFMSSDDWNVQYQQSVLQLLSCNQNPAQAACRVKPIP